ncbi:uncharacterized protein SOCEGT47_074610 [Sorangium cellulosum]|uniref:3-dehydroquinate dehydratase n=1 Tax=Sorangium cellulosum TaxID=56 RepID=A0A4P2QC11_SORCE|nr:type I 3-dehydroquinate dehydratase [Sorangium cellulosum]AUX26891.1 uncharacterized protein SOCEGT47_074610 [Sorangium cellulosum]
MMSKVAVSIAPKSPSECRAGMAAVAGRAGFVEVRLDAMERIDPDALRHAPLPVIATCRPMREGGRFGGPERERLDILRCASQWAAYVDIEWDTADRFESARARTLVSRHWFDHMPDLHQEYRRLRRRGDAVKLAAPARTAEDAAHVLDVLAAATSPLIAIGMGDAGRHARLAALALPHCLATYVALKRGQETAPGQPSLDDVLELS